MIPTFLNMLALATAMVATGLIGFLLARERYRGETDHQLHVLGGELKRMRRRTRDAEKAADKLRTEQLRTHRVRKSKV